MRADQGQPIHDAAEASMDMLQEPVEHNMSLAGNSMSESSSKYLTVRAPDLERDEMHDYKGQRRARNLVPLMAAICEPVVDQFAETREGIWATGDDVQVRDHESAAWMDGKVVSVRPLRVQLIGGKGAYNWNQIQPKGYTSCEAQTRDKRRHDAHCRRSQHAACRLANTRYCARRRLQRESEERAKQADKELAQRSKPFRGRQRPRAQRHAETLTNQRFREAERPAKEPSAASKRFLEAALLVASEAADECTLELAGSVNAADDEVCQESKIQVQAASCVSGDQLSSEAEKINADPTNSREASSEELLSPQTTSLACPQAAVDSSLSRPALEEDFNEGDEGDGIPTSGAAEAASMSATCVPEFAEKDADPTSPHISFPTATTESNHASDAMAADSVARKQANDVSCLADAAAAKTSFCARQFYKILGEIGLTAPEALQKLSTLELRELASDLGLGEQRRIDTREELQLALMYFLWSDRAKRMLPQGAHKKALERLARPKLVPGRDEASVRALRDRLTELEVHEEGPLTLVQLREVFAGLGADFDTIAWLPADEVRRLAGHLGLPGEKAAGIIARLKSLSWSGRAVLRSPSGLQAEKLAKLSRTRSPTFTKDFDSCQSCDVVSGQHIATPGSRESKMDPSETHSSCGDTQVENSQPELPGSDFVDNQMPKRPPMRLTKARERTMIG